MKAASLLALACACVLSLLASGCASSRGSASAPSGPSPSWALADSGGAASSIGWTVRPVSDSP